MLLMSKEIILYLLETSGDEIAKALQNRRKNGGCSMWRDVGLKWISDNDKYDLLKYDWEWDYINKHYKELNEDDKVKKLKCIIPDNPFDEVDDEDDDFENSELTYSQNVKFRKYLDELGYKDFSQWWNEIGKDKVNDMYSEEISTNFVDGDILEHFDKFINSQLDMVIGNQKK